MYSLELSSYFITNYTKILLHYMPSLGLTSDSGRAPGPSRLAELCVRAGCFSLPRLDAAVLYSDDLILAGPRPQFVMETTRHNNKIFDPRLAQTAKIYPPPVTALDMSVKNPIIKASCGCWYCYKLYLFRCRDQNVMTRERERDRECPD